MSTSPPREKRKPEPKTESGYRGGIFDQIDVPAVTSFTACLLLFILALVGIRNVDYSKLDKPSLEQISERVARIIMPLKPPGKPIPKPEAPAGGVGRPRGPAGAGKGDATALARIERSRATVAQQITQVQERITKAAVLSILSGKGPGTTGRTVGRASGGKGGGDRFAGFGDLDARMGSIEGLTKYDGKKGDFNREGSAPARRKEEAEANGIDNVEKGFATAKANIGKKMGVANLETPTATDRSAKFTGNRSPSDVAAFIARKQATVSLLYEERLKSNPALEGKITVVMIIEEDGTISNVSVLRSETTLDDPDFTEELLRRIKRWIFPPSTGGPVEMKSPFVFRPA
jgi:TonB family protein